MPPADYAIHDVTVRDTPNFDRGGTITMKTQVTFFIGAHGPFQLTYNKDQATGAQIQSDIQKQVQVLRTITGEP